LRRLGDSDATHHRRYLRALPQACTAIVEHVADAAAASSGEDRFEIEAQLLRRLMQDLPRQIKAAEEAARRTNGLDS
jgi:hypothetical protein